MIPLPIEPMLAQPTPAPAFENGQWRFALPFTSDKFVFEPKYDGMRCIAVRQAGKVLLYARSARLINGDFPDLADSLAQHPDKWKKLPDFVMDGEIIGFDHAGQTSFNALQRRQLDSIRVEYRPFDLLYLDGTRPHGDIQGRTLAFRRSLLEQTITPTDDSIALTPQVHNGRLLWQLAVDHGAEGIIAKPSASTYHQGQRGPWLKVKVLHRREVVVVGYTSGEGTRNGLFGALVLAEPTESGWKYAGKVGTGFTIDSAAQVLRAMRPLETEKPVFERAEMYRIKTHLGPRTVTWVRPQLHATVEFSELTKDGVPRFPSFKGLTQ